MDNKIKRKVKLTKVFDTELQVLISVVMSIALGQLARIHDATDTLNLGSFIIYTLWGFILFATLAVFVYVLMVIVRYLSVLPRVIRAKNNISKMPLTYDELEKLNINSLEEYFEYVRENIKTTHDIFDDDSVNYTFELNDEIFFTKEQSRQFSEFTRQLILDTCEGKLNQWKDDSRFKDSPVKLYLFKGAEIRLVHRTIFESSPNKEIFEGVYASYYDQIDVIVDRCI